MSKIKGKKLFNFFGLECYNYIEVLARAWGDINVNNSILRRLARAYIRLFGIPEIGLQLRGLHFSKFLSNFCFENKPIFRVLDAGCGLGIFSYHLKKRYSSASIDACDVDIEYIRMGEKIVRELKIGKINFFQKDLLELSKKDEYDLIILVDVLEHIENDEKVINNLYKALKYTGILYLHVPKKNVKWKHYKWFLPLIRKEYHMSKSHIRNGYTKNEIINILKNNNFKIVSVRNTLGVIGWLALEINSLALVFLPLLVSALIFPYLVLILPLDLLFEKSGNALQIIAQKS